MAKYELKYVDVLLDPSLFKALFRASRENKRTHNEIIAILLTNALREAGYTINLVSGEKRKMKLVKKSSKKEPRPSPELSEDQWEKAGLGMRERSIPKS